MVKKEALQETIRTLEHLISNIGEKTTEYHWREFSDLSKCLVEAFPEYNLVKTIIEYNEEKLKELNEIQSDRNIRKNEVGEGRGW